MSRFKIRIWGWAHQKGVTTNDSIAPHHTDWRKTSGDQGSRDGAFDPKTLIESAARENAKLNQSIEDLRNQLQIVHGMLAHERHRVDSLLAGAEGILDEIERFHEIRKSERYQAAFNASKPLISVLVATMDRCDLLIDRCIKSIRAQSYDNLQVIVVGDHCTDDTERRLAELRDDRICFINLTERGPYPRSREERRMVAGTYPANEALQLVEGGFITYLDDDDAYDPERIEILLGAARKEKADFVWHPHFWRQADGSWLPRGNGNLELGQVGLGMVMYHAYLGRIRQDVYAYRLKEPGDWNLIRKLKALRPRVHFVDKPLTYFFKDWTEIPFVDQPGEQFIE
jgi:Glycosyl transferase family 2